MSLESQIISNLMSGNDKPIKVRKAIEIIKDEKDEEMELAELRADTLSHIDEVKQGLEFLASLLVQRGINHDHTKLDNLPAFSHDLRRAFKGDDLMGWWELHLKERHHLNDSVPPDVNLIDICEFLVDCCVAGAARDGSVRPIELPYDILVKAFKNTRKLLCENIEIVGEVEIE